MDMAKKNQMTFIFPQDQEADHPDPQMTFDYRADYPREQKARRAPTAQADKDTASEKSTAQGFSAGTNERAASEKPVQPAWDDPHQILARPKKPGLPFSAYQKRHRPKGRRNDPISRRKTDRPFWSNKKGWKALLTAGAAMIAGLVMGLTVLSVFSNLSSEEKMNHAGNESMEGRVPDLNASDAAEMNDGEQGASLGTDAPHLIPAGSVEDGVVTLPSRSYYVVQAGVFSEEDKAQSAVEQLADADLSGLLMREDDAYRLYAGIGVERETADTVAQMVQEKGFETYVREHVIADISGQQVDVEEDALSMLPTFLAKGDELVAQLSGVTVNGLSTPDYTFSDETWTDLQNRHHAFLEEGKPLFQAWQGEEQAIGQQMMREMNSAFQALENYKNETHPAYLWLVQQALLNYVQQYGQLIASLNAS